MKTLEGTFVRLVPVAPEHAAAIVKWRNAESARFINRGSATVEDQLKWINSRPASEFNFVIEFEKRPVGQISLYDISAEHKTASSGRLVLAPDLPKGYPITFEAILLVHAFAFRELGLNKVSGIVAANNHGVVKLNEFIRMKREGILRQHFIFDSVCQDGIAYGLLKDEFINEQEPLLTKMVRMLKGTPAPRGDA